MNMLWFYFVFLIPSSGSKSQYFITEPRDKTAMAGKATILSCKVGDRRGKCQWTKDGFGLGNSEDLPGFPRFSMKLGPNNCHLEIEPVLPEDSGIYRCQVGASGGIRPITSAEAKLRVISEPGQPYILEGASSQHYQVKKGEQLILQCVSQGSNPAADIEWFNNKEIVLGSVEEEESKIHGTNTFKTISTLTITPATNMNVTCSAKSDEFPEEKYSRNLKVYVRHKPITDISFSKPKIKEGDSFEVICRADSFPEDVAYRWFFSGKELKGEVNDTLVLEEISRMYHNTDVKCLVENEEGKTEASTKLDVEFPPTILLHPKSQIAKKNDKVTFHCVAEGNPQPVYLWTKGSPVEGTLAGYRQNLTLIASEKTENSYVCKVFSDEYEIASSMPASLTLIRRPVIVLDTTKYGVRGQDAILQCTVHTVSNNTVVVWTKDDSPLNTDLQQLKFKVVKTFREGKQHSDLLIRSLSEDDFSEYGCFASNEVGTDYKVIELTNEKPTDYIYYLIGVSSLIIICLTMIITIYCKCCRKDYSEVPMKV